MPAQPRPHPYRPGPHRRMRPWRGGRAEPAHPPPRSRRPPARLLPLLPSFSHSPLGALLRAHVLAPDAGDDHRLLHGVAAERLAQLLIEDHLDEGRHPVLLRLARLAQRFGQLRLGPDRHALEATTLSHFRITQMRIELGADEVIVVPEDRVPLLRAPLVIAEDDHGDGRPLVASD